MEKTSKSKPANAVPEGFHTVTPFLIVDGAERLISFIKDAFDGKQLFISKDDDGKVIHATVSIGNSRIMLSDTMGMPAQTSMLYLYVENVDEVYRKAVKAKGISVHEPSDEFYGDRAAAVKDEWGNVWWMATHVEEVDEKELDKRAKQVMKERNGKEPATH
jgi:PhnB protein